MRRAQEILKLIGEQEKNFPHVSMLVRDDINGRPVVLEIGRNHYSRDDKEIRKVDHLYRSTEEERKYLERAFANSDVAHRFSAYNGQYELFYPIQTKHGVAVLLFSQYQRYGKSGS
jgi:hypothetical protein